MTLNKKSMKKIDLGQFWKRVDLSWDCNNIHKSAKKLESELVTVGLHILGNLFGYEEQKKF